MKTPKLTLSDSATGRLRQLLNGKLRNRNEYNINNVSAIWHVTSCKGVDLPKCTGGILYPPKTRFYDYKVVVFVTDPIYNNWAEDSGLEIRCKWVNEHHIHHISGKVTQVVLESKKTYADVHSELWKLVDDLATPTEIAAQLEIPVNRAMYFKRKMRIEQAEYRTKQKNKKRVRLHDK